MFHTHSRFEVSNNPDVESKFNLDSTRHRHRSIWQNRQCVLQENTTMEYTFHHVHLRCEDLEAAIAFYENVLGGKITERAGARGLTFVVMDVGGQNIFLSPKFGDIDVEATTGNPRWGVYQLAFLVDDIDAAVEELQAKGAELEDLKPSGLPMAFFKGPDNVQIEVIEAS